MFIIYFETKAGDALIILWRCEARKTMAAQARVAIRCACSMVHILNNYEVRNQQMTFILNLLKLTDRQYVGHGHQPLYICT